MRSLKTEQQQTVAQTNGWKDLMDYEVKGVKSRGRPKTKKTEVADKNLH